jgi:Cu-Zn family superoxide dismutase
MPHLIRIASAVALVSLLAARAAVAQAPAAAPASVEVKLIDAANKPVGTARLTQTAHGVLIAVDLHDFKPGAHAIHIHETAKCEPPAFKSAGGHDNPKHKQHGFQTAEGPHAGDLPNLEVPASGSVKAEFIAPDESLEGPDGLFAGDGSALVIHAKADDYKTQPAGDAGDRVACGVIQKG